MPLNNRYLSERCNLIHASSVCFQAAGQTMSHSSWMYLEEKYWLLSKLSCYLCFLPLKASHSILTRVDFWYHSCPGTLQAVTNGRSLTRGNHWLANGRIDHRIVMIMTKTACLPAQISYQKKKTVVTMVSFVLLSNILLFCPIEELM